MKKFFVEARKAVVAGLGIASSLSVAIGDQSQLGHYIAIGIGIVTLVLHYWTPNGLYIDTKTIVQPDPPKM